MVSLLKSYIQQKKKSKDMSTLSSKKYFFGKISRQRAEEILLESGGEDGRFLIRECLSSPSDFSMAICFNGKSYHYQFQFRADGTINISRLVSFANIDKMITHYSKKSCGLITRLTHPCQREIFGGAQVWPSINQTKALLYMTEAGKDKSSKYEDVIKQIYRKQPWFKGGMSRDESKEYLLEGNNGEFLIREKSDGTLALSLAKEGMDYHYVIDIMTCPRTGSTSYKINPGPQFDNIMELVTYYHNGGLACPLYIDYNGPKESIPWLKNNPAFKKDNLVDKRNDKLHRFSKSLESLDILFEGKFEEEDEIPSLYFDLRNRNLLAEEALKLHNKVSLVFPKPQRIPDIRIPHCSSDRILRKGLQNPTKCKQNTENPLIQHQNQSPAQASLVKCNRQTLVPEETFISKSRSPSRSPRAIQKMPLIGQIGKSIGEEKSIKKTKKMIHQKSAPSDQEGARKFSLTTSDLKTRPKLDSVNEPCRLSFDESSDESLTLQNDIAPPKSHIRLKHLTKPRVPTSNQGTKHEEINYELEKAFLAMMKEAFHSDKKEKEKMKKLQPYNVSISASLNDTILKAENLIEISEDQLSLSTTIGTGNFGIVQKAILNGSTTVAVKTFIPGPHEKISELELMKEACLMSTMDHENIVKVLGICRSSGSLMLVLELAHLGNLKNMVKTRNIPEEKNLRVLKQVCEGMSFLESKHIIHRDLAARNILLFKDWVAKISDFGLSRSLNSKSDYEFIGKKALPLKWYPPEVFNDNKFSHKSDVWSFGVSIWESMSSGDDPYSELNVKQYFDFINSGQRLKKPERCSEGLYQVMQLCWHKREGNRPTFKELKIYLKTPYLAILES